MTAFTEIFSSRHCLQIVKLFLYKPSVDKYQTEVVNESGLSYMTAVKCLNLLVSNDLLSESWKGGLKIYTLNRDSPVVRQLKILLIVAEIYDSAKAFAGQGFELYLYGSAARGEDTENSDVDLLVIGRIDSNALVEVTDKIEKATGREAKPIVYSQIEFADLSRTSPAFYESITRDRIRII